MQYDMGRFDQPLVDETQPKAHAWTDIGEAEVEYSVFGNAKVRVYRKRDEVRGALSWMLATVSLVVGAVWLISDVSRQPEIVYVAPPAPAVAVAMPEPKKVQPVVPQIQPRAAPPIASQSPVPQLQAHSAPDLVRPAPAAVKPAAVVAPVAVLVNPAAPSAPLASKPVVTQTPVVAASAATATH